MADDTRRKGSSSGDDVPTRRASVPPSREARPGDDSQPAEPARGSTPSSPRLRRASKLLPEQKRGSGRLSPPGRIAPPERPSGFQPPDRGSSSRITSGERGSSSHISSLPERASSNRIAPLPPPDPNAARLSASRISAARISSPAVAPAPVEITPTWWILVAHTLGAAALGALDAARLHSLGIVLAVVPLFAAMGLVTGAICAALERIVKNRRWWVAALVTTAPALIIFGPVAATLFDGAYAQTLPLAGAAPFLLPVLLWLLAAGAVAVGRRLLRAGDLTTRAIAVLAIAGVIGGVLWAERHVLGTGYPRAHLGATLALLVLMGLAVRVTRRGGMPYLVAAVISGLTVGGAIIACLGGLREPADRQRLASYGEHSRDLVGLWRSVLDFDRDGSSPLLGGGDCDDHDDTRHPGALDKPGDGIDQDCDGSDAAPPSVKPAPAANAEEHADWRSSPDVAQLLARTRGMHVVVITVDALRADLLAPDAPDRDDFPTLTKLLADSVWFTHAIAPATGTDVSLATFLTGRFDPFQPVATTLPEAMRAAGRKTFAALPAEVLRYAGEALLGRGVDKLVTVHTDWDTADVGDHVSAPTTSGEGIKALGDLGDRPGFLWVHYFDVHEHHQIDVPAKLRDAVHAGGSPKMHAYRALLRAIDNEVGRLLDELAKRDLSDKTIIVFASDHGESLGEDPRLLETHGKVTYAPLVRIPIAFHIPGVTPGVRTDPVSLVDLAPTLLALTGITPADMPLDGLDLLPALLDAPAALRQDKRALAVHEELQWSIVDWPYQLIVRPADNIVELYDLDKDPAQREDLASAQPDVVGQLKARYAAFPRVTVDRTPTGRSERERLARQRPTRAP